MASEVWLKKKSAPPWVGHLWQKYGLNEVDPKNKTLFSGMLSIRERFVLNDEE